MQLGLAGMIMTNAFNGNFALVYPAGDEEADDGGESAVRRQIKTPALPCPPCCALLGLVGPGWAWLARLVCLNARRLGDAALSASAPASARHPPAKGSWRLGDAGCMHTLRPSVLGSRRKPLFFCVCEFARGVR